MPSGKGRVGSWQLQYPVGSGGNSMRSILTNSLDFERIKETS
jgi:hypothetical protein